MEIKLGIIGFGFMGHEHANMMQTLDEISLKAVCDTDTSQLEDAPEGVERYTNVETMLEKQISIPYYFSPESTAH